MFGFSTKLTCTLDKIFMKFVLQNSLSTYNYVRNVQPCKLPLSAAMTPELSTSTNVFLEVFFFCTANLSLQLLAFDSYVKRYT